MLQAPSASHLAADHDRCGRCTRRGKAGQCTYVVAPMSKRRAGDKESIETPSLSTNASRTTKQHSNGSDGESSKPRGAIGFLGPTSFSAVFEQDQGNRNEIKAIGTRSARPIQAMSASYIHKGSQVIMLLLRNLPMYQRAGRRLEYMWDAGIVSRPLFQLWHEEILTSFGHVVSTSTDMHEKCQELSKMVWQNTRRPVDVNEQMTMEEYARFFTGLNLRWEVVGICEVMNEVYLMLLVQDGCLLEHFVADANLVAWKQHGSTCDTLVAMGIHRASKKDKDTPFWFHELRKRLLAACFCRDTSFSYYLGRPPRLSSKFCLIDLPLDFPTKDLMLEGEALQNVTSALDGDGWNTNRKAHSMTWQRLRVQYCRVRETILEIALGTDDCNHISAEVEQIRQDARRLPEMMPRWLQNAFEDVIQRLKKRGLFGCDSVREQSTEISLISIHLGFLQTEFLLERALINRGLKERKELLPIVRTILDVVVLAVSIKDRFQDCPGEIASVFASHGIPCAGVLAIELLKEQQSGERTISQTPGARSDAIQKLVLLVTALAAVGENNSYKDICHHYEAVLRRLLDQILEPVSTPAPAASDEQDMYNMSSANLLFPADHDLDFLQWLENFEQ
nr:hypothetical protein CFP56_52157 [Quercus suber]